MNSLNIDLRDESLRVLSVKDGKVRHALISGNFPASDPKAARQQLSTAVSEAGGAKGTVHVILPQRVVKSGIFQVPAVDIIDAQKVVRREIAKELGTQDFVMGIREIFRARQGKQEILAEYALKSDMREYLGLLRECGIIRPSVITTCLEGILAAFSRIRPRTEGNEAVLEIGQSFIEIIIINNGRLINYRKVPMPAVDESKLTGKDMDHAQICKIKMYMIIDALYNFIMETGSAAAEEKISRIWVSGMGSIEEGTTECVSESLAVGSSLINPFDAVVEHASVYTAVAGLSMLKPSDQVVNLLLPDLNKDGLQLARKSVLIIALAFHVILICGGYIVLSGMERDLKILYDKALSEQSREASRKSADLAENGHDAVRKIQNNNRNLYGIFRDIANLTPADISLTGLDIEKTAEITYLKLEAGLQAGEEGLRTSSVSTFLKALEGTGRLRMASPPEITTAKVAPGVKKQAFSVRAAFEVLP